MSLKCLIVDDEPRAHIVLRHYIEKIPGLQLADSCFGATQACEYLRENDIDIIFLDIKMPKLDGFSLLELVETKAAVIITTAYTGHAFKSYEYDVVDYLHKPIRFERFQKAVAKAQLRLPSKEKPVEIFIEIKKNGELHRLASSSILYTKSLGNYVKIYCNNGTSHITHITTKELLGMLPADLFVRVHKSYIVNLSSITAIEKETLRTGNDTMPIGKIYKIYLEEQLRRYHGRTGFIHK